MLLAPTRTFTEVQPLEQSLELPHLVLKTGRGRRVRKRIKLLMLLPTKGRKLMLIKLQKESVSTAMKLRIEEGIALNTWLKRRKSKKVNMIYLCWKLIWWRMMIMAR